MRVKGVVRWVLCVWMLCLAIEARGLGRTAQTLAPTEAQGTPAATLEASPGPSASVTPVATATRRPTPRPTARPTPTPVREALPTRTPKTIVRTTLPPLPVRTATPRPTQTPTPQPTASPTPTPSPTMALTLEQDPVRTPEPPVETAPPPGLLPLVRFWPTELVQLLMLCLLVALAGCLLWYLRLGGGPEEQEGAGEDDPSPEDPKDAMSRSKGARKGGGRDA